MRTFNKSLNNLNYKIGNGDKSLVLSVKPTAKEMSLLPNTEDAILSVKILLV